jgi:hypothetical protein
VNCILFRSSIRCSEIQRGGTLRAGDHCREIEAKGNGDPGASPVVILGRELDGPDIFGCTRRVAR